MNNYNLEKLKTHLDDYLPEVTIVSDGKIKVGKRHDNIIRHIEKLIEGINDLKIEVVKKEFPMFIEKY